MRAWHGELVLIVKYISCEAARCFVYGKRAVYRVLVNSEFMAVLMLLAVYWPAECVCGQDLPGVTDQFCTKFESLRYSSAGKDQSQTVEAFLHAPRQISPGATYPLVVWLHGAGVEEFDHPFGPLLHIPTTCGTKFDPPQQDEFFMLVPRCPRTEGDWYVPGSSEGDMLANADWLLEKILREHPIDPGRVSLVGISSGGKASWEWAARRPDRFAAVAPIAAGAADLGRLSDVGNTPTWAFAKSDDGDVGERAQSSVDMIRENGGNAYLTRLEGTEHDAWTEAFLEFDLFDWLVSKSRSDAPMYLPPGYRPALWPWNYFIDQSATLLLIIGGVLLCGTCIREFKHRRKNIALGSAQVGAAETRSPDEKS